MASPASPARKVATMTSCTPSIAALRRSTSRSVFGAAAMLLSSTSTTLCLVEHRAHRFGNVAAALRLRTVDLGDDGGLRRSRRHFDDLHVRVEAATDLLQGRPNAHRNGVALLASVMLVDEIHLDVADLATGAQVILAHQAVEVDRGAGA